MAHHTYPDNNSNSCFLFLVPPAVITEHPEVLVNSTVGDSVMFQCTAQSFGRPKALQYYWLEIGDNNTAIPIDSATTNTLQFIAVAEDDSKYYQCAATNENDTVFSNVGRLHCKYTYILYINCTSVTWPLHFTVYILLVCVRACMRMCVCDCRILLIC